MDSGDDIVKQREGLGRGLLVAEAAPLDELAPQKFRKRIGVGDFGVRISRVNAESVSPVGRSLGLAAECVEGLGLEGGDNMAFFGKGELISTGLRLRDLFLEKFISNPEIVAPKDIRLNFKNKKNKTNE